MPHRDCPLPPGARPITSFVSIRFRPCSRQCHAVIRVDPMDEFVQTTCCCELGGSGIKSAVLSVDHGESERVVFSARCHGEFA